MFIFALVALFAWGLADLFYKKGTDELDKHSHLKIAVWVGIVMGACALILLPFAETEMTAKSFFVSLIKYGPASICYIVSMVVGYAGLRYLEVSIISPVQNASGGFSALIIIIYTVLKGEKVDVPFLEVYGIVLTVMGVIALAAVEKGREKSEYSFGAKALLFPLAYCLFDTLGTAADGIILDEQNGLGLGEIDVLVLYGFTFFLFGLAAWIFMFVKDKKPYNPIARGEKDKALAAVSEEAGQVFYVLAMARNPVVAAPMVASYCAVSILLSRIFLKEKLTKPQYACILVIVAGIITLGFCE